MTSTKEQLCHEYVGTSLSDPSYSIPSPAAVLDLATLEPNCKRMLEAVETLGLEWRPHIKTHKTTELTRLQVGDKPGSPVNLVVSTVKEAENILPLLKEYQDAGRVVNVLYGFPLHASAVVKLVKVAKTLGRGGVSVMVDHVQQLQYVASLATAAGHAPLVFMKVDGGYHRAGAIPHTAETKELVDALVRLHVERTAIFHGLYIHAGHSYDSREDWQALKFLLEEIEVLGQFAAAINKGSKQQLPLVLSVGASPTATSLQHPCIMQSGESVTCSHRDSEICRSLKDQMQRLKSNGYRIEAHAGVYPVLDLQQLATHARSPELLSSSDISISILADVVSLYPGRGPNGTTEALINVGCLGLGREPCKDLGPVKGAHYSNWGIVMPWSEAGMSNPPPTSEFPAVHGGWQVVKVSQEHGILGWKGDKSAEIPLKVGQRIRIWPNHACIAGAFFDWYLVVDSRNNGAKDTVVDVWPRWRGW